MKKSRGSMIAALSLLPAGCGASVSEAAKAQRLRRKADVPHSNPANVTPNVHAPGRDESQLGARGDLRGWLGVGES